MSLEDWDPELTSDGLVDLVSPPTYFSNDWNYAFHQDPGIGEALLNELEGLMGSLEGVAPSDADGLHTVLLRRLPRLWKWIVDWWYSKECIERIPGLVDRFLKLSPVLMQVRPAAPRINVYLREATRCYLYELSSASVALARAALEAGLDEHLQRRLGHVPNLDLAGKISQAARFNLLRRETASFADSVRHAANQVLHEEPCSEQQAFDVLIQARKALIELYEH